MKEECFSINSFREETFQKTLFFVLFAQKIVTFQKFISNLKTVLFTPKWYENETK